MGKGWLTPSRPTRSTGASLPVKEPLSSVIGKARSAAGPHPGVFMGQLRGSQEEEISGKPQLTVTTIAEVKASGSLPFWEPVLVPFTPLLSQHQQLL